MTASRTPKVLVGACGFSQALVDPDRCPKVAIEYIYPSLGVVV
jgi:hypothetical protein